MTFCGNLRYSFITMTMAAQRSIIMNFREPPAESDMLSLAQDIIEQLPHELEAVIAGLQILVEDFPSTEVETELELEDSFDLLALYRCKSEKIPGVENKVSSAEPTLILYRRPILDVWCDTQDDLKGLIRHIIVTELAQANGFNEEEADTMALRHQQGMV